MNFGNDEKHYILYKNMDKEQCSVELKLYFLEYISYFNENYNLLIERYNRFKELREQGFNLDSETFFDALIVQLRAFMLDKSGSREHGIGSYTLQNLFTLAEDDEMQRRLEKMLDTAVIDGIDGCDECLLNYECSQYRKDCPVKEPVTVGEAIKTIADKTICHYDNYYKPGSISWDYIQTIKKILYDQKEKINIDFVIDTLIGMLHNGVSLNLLSIDDALEDN